MLPTLFVLKLGSYEFPLNTFGLFGAFGILLGSWLGTWLAKKNGFGADQALDIVLAHIVGVVVGSKLLQLVAEWDHYQHDPWSILSLKEIGVFYGGLLGSATAVTIRCRIKKWDVWKAADMMAPSFALAHALSRLGCFSAGCCYGRPTTSDFGVAFPSVSMAYQTLLHSHPKLINDAHTVPLIPTQLLEAGFEFTMAGLLTVLFFVGLKKEWRAGWIVIFWVGPYSIFRFLIEGVRFDAERGTVFGLMSTSQFIGAGLIIACIVGAIYLYKNPNPVHDGDKKQNDDAD
ncbi:MAG: prolipoprotein diacylglyceryl transferase [Deltaproteobacteria bacterium]|nr:prolipoprotein diacylglyceryl transferase [Deltaproteobacteria bacterium]